MSERKQQTYVVSVEVKALAGSAMWGSGVGGFAYCYTRASDARDAADRVAKALREDCYDLIAVEWIRPSSDVAWDDDDDEEQRGYAEEARVSGNVVYSPFNVYESEHGM